MLYRYSARHDANAVDAMLAGYKGYLVADAHAVYDHLYRGGDVIEVGCWAHARRYFFKALESEPERAREALALIGELFRIERQIAEAPTDLREAERRRESRPVVERFFAWCKATVAQALDETPLANGLRYALNQQSALMRFLDDGRLPIHNNHSEQRGQRLLRIAPGELPAARHRTVGILARPVLPAPELARTSRIGAGASWRRTVE